MIQENPRLLIWNSQFHSKVQWKQAANIFSETSSVNSETLCEKVRFLVSTVFNNENEITSVYEFILQHKVLQKEESQAEPSILKFLEKILNLRYISPRAKAENRKFPKQQKKPLEPQLIAFFEFIRTRECPNSKNHQTYDVPNPTQNNPRRRDPKDLEKLKLMSQQLNKDLASLYLNTNSDQNETPTFSGKSEMFDPGEEDPLLIEAFRNHQI